MNQEVYDQIKFLERQLHSTAVRSDLNKFKMLLHDDFKEIGRSGKIYNKSDVLNQLDEHKNPSEIISEEFQYRLLSETIVLVTYRSYQRFNLNQSHLALRSSVWIFNQDRWQMIFHQGTPI